ncbi:9949_t:CDS:2, partial [Acaulospora colombiana]
MPVLLFDEFWKSGLLGKNNKLDRASYWDTSYWHTTSINQTLLDPLAVSMIRGRYSRMRKSRVSNDVLQCSKEYEKSYETDSDFRGETTNKSVRKCDMEEIRSSLVR